MLKGVEFNKKNKSRFWDRSCDHETHHRMLVPDAMNISFSSITDAYKFIISLKESKNFNNIITNDIPSNKHIIEKKLNISLIIDSGIEINLNVFVTKPHLLILPPYNNLDMLCNGFIMSRIFGTMFSMNTGTVIDHYSYYERTIAIAGIMKDMIKFKTYICLSSRYGFKDLNITAINAIEKMERKHNCKWQFLNLPFKTVTVKTNEECCICCTPITKDMSYTESAGVISAKMHYKCLMKYLRFQSKTITDTDDKIVFHCPYRNIIDFASCKSAIESVYI